MGKRNSRRPKRTSTIGKGENHGVAAVPSTLRKPWDVLESILELIERFEQRVEVFYGGARMAIEEIKKRLQKVFDNPYLGGWKPEVFALAKTGVKFNFRPEASPSKDDQQALQELNRLLTETGELVLSLRK